VYTLKVFLPVLKNQEAYFAGSASLFSYTLCLHFCHNLNFGRLFVVIMLKYKQYEL